jgi:hypothetical protein
MLFLFKYKYPDFIQIERRVFFPHYVKDISQCVPGSPFLKILLKDKILAAPAPGFYFFIKQLKLKSLH